MVLFVFIHKHTNLEWEYQPVTMILNESGHGSSLYWDHHLFTTNDT